MFCMNSSMYVVNRHHHCPLGLDNSHPYKDASRIVYSSWDCIISPMHPTIEHLNCMEEPYPNLFMLFVKKCNGIPMLLGLRMKHKPL